MTGVYAAELGRRVALAPGAVWAALEDTAAYTTWWPWLETFDPSGGLTQGATWRAAVRAPLPYTVGFTLDLHGVDRDAGKVHAAVSGDVDGIAEVRLAPDGGGTHLTMSWRLVPARPFLRALDATARPLARWGHDVVMRRSVDAFVRAVEGRS
jgi:uncharacterized protein YndB with AHSA1/START domain